MTSLTHGFEAERRGRLLRLGNHLNILSQGIEKWNQWRREHPEIQPDLEEANLTGADLMEANTTEASVGWTVFGDVDLSVVKGLETVKHEGPSTIGIDTIYRPKGNISEAFLKRAGVPETFLMNMLALLDSMHPIDFYSCIISYSSKDQDFAERLYADLQSKGIRCWFVFDQWMGALPHIKCACLLIGDGNLVLHCSTEKDSYEERGE